MFTQLKYGVVSDIKKGYVKAFFEDDEITTDWLPVLVRKTKSDVESWQLEVHEHIVCLMDDHCNTGVVIGAIPNEKDPGDPGEGPGKYRKLFADGTLIEYDQNTGKMTVDVKGSLEAKTEGAALIDATGNLTAKTTRHAPVTN